MNFIFFILASLFATTLQAQEIAIPIRVDYQTLTKTLLAQRYTGPNPSLEIWNDGDGCSSVVLTQPSIDSDNGLLRIKNQTDVTISLPMNSKCMPMYQWSGTLVTLHQLQVGPSKATVHFPTTQAFLYNADQTPLETGRAWELIKQFAGPELEQLQIDLRPALAELKQFVAELLPDTDATTARTLLDTISLSTITAQDQQIVITLSIPVESKPLEQATSPVPALTAAELSEWQSNWQQWDALLTYTIRQVAMQTKSTEIRDALLAMLIDTRTEIQSVLADPDTPASPDPIRALFFRTWEQLAPVLLQIAQESPEALPLHYIAFIAAGDALQALDALGPSFGIELSANGLRRMARMLAPTDDSDPLQFRWEIDHQLRELFRFEPPKEAATDTRKDPLAWLIRPAQASTARITSSELKKLNRWAPTRADIQTYIPLAKQLLTQTTQDIIKAKSLDPSFTELFEQLVLATAWQETCWRQYVVKGSKIKPIKSSSGSVGIMQVNPSVWRGFYDVNKLTHDIAYNANAGGEILLHYLKDYAIKKQEHIKTGKLDNLARAAYSAYHGGPRHLTRYRQATAKPALHKIDSAFLEKFQAIKQGRSDSVANCYGEQLAIATSKQATKSSINPPAPKPPTPVKSKQPNNHSTALLAKNAHHHTIQLMASRNEVAIKQFIAQHELSNAIRYYPYRHDQETWYAVVYGDYPTRQQAHQALSKLQGKLGVDQPWIRSFASIQQLSK